MRLHLAVVVATAGLLGAECTAEIVIVTRHNPPGQDSAEFSFSNLPTPSRNDAAGAAIITIVDGRVASRGGGIAALNDGRLPSEDDEPSRNFYFDAGTLGGRLLVDLGRMADVKEVNTYSWHSDSRGPQVYALYAGDGADANFNARPNGKTDPLDCGWKLLARVDTRPGQGKRNSGGQYAVSICDSGGSLGRLRYLLFDISRTEADDPFGNTFFSEMDVVERDGPAPEKIPGPERVTKVIEVKEGERKCRITIDTTGVPDLREWAEKELGGLAATWYPKLVRMLPSDGFEPHSDVVIRFTSGTGEFVAYASGNRVNCNSGWFRKNLNKEARGCVLHELVHVVQHYDLPPRRNTATSASKAPSWLVEGIADYIRWFLYEPESKGAEITRANLSRANYDASYRITANFLNWVTVNHDPDIAAKLNAAARERRYDEKLWKDFTGKTVKELGADWKAEHQKRLLGSPQP